MQKKRYEMHINAPREKVWSVLWDDRTYREWTAVFSPTSYALTDWERGSKALFLDGNGSGMVSRIAENIPNEHMSIEHLGEVRNGEEDTTSDRVKKWAGAHENYTLVDSNGGTELIVEMDITPEFAAMFDGIWPLALARIRDIAEGRHVLSQL